MKWFNSKTEVSLTFLMLLAIGYQLFFLLANGYLDRPFFYDKSDTFMDFFNTEYWSFDQGRYTDWGSIYTPFSFLLTQLVGCNFSGGADDPFLYRQENIACFLLFLVIVTSFVAYYVYRKYKNIYYLSVVLLSSPLLFAIERGNLLVFLLPFLFLFVKTKNDLFKGLILGLAISLKIYFVALLFVFLLMRSYRVIAISMLSFLSLNIVSALVINAEDWLLFIDNIFMFSGEPKFYEWSYFSYSYRNLLLGLVELRPALSDWLFGIDIAVLMLVFLTFALSSLHFMKLSDTGKQENSVLLMLLLLMLVMIVVKNAGGYVFLLLFPFLFFIRNSILVSMLLFLLVLPVSYPLYELNNSISTNALLTSEVVEFQYSIDTGMILRPAVFFLLYFLLSYRLIGRNVVYDK